MKRKAFVVVILSIPVFALDFAIAASGKLPWAQTGIPFIAIFLLVRRRDGQKVQADERSVRIEGRASTYIVPAMLASFWILKAVLNRKADVEWPPGWRNIARAST
jgi:uncharacterized membrane protein